MKSCTPTDRTVKFKRLAGYVTSLDIPTHASYTGYFTILSVFPLLVLMMNLLRYTGLQVETLVNFLDGVLPTALMPAVERLILNTYRNSSGVMISFSALTALWSASRGIYGLLRGLNCVYEVKEDRGYLFTRGISVVYTFLFLLVLLLTLVLHVFGNSLLGMLPHQDGMLFRILARVIHSRFFMLLLIQTTLFTAVYTVFPNRRNKIQQSLPGALFASLGWLLFSNLYSLYVERITLYTTIFGSVYAIALSMLWLYWCLSIVFYGGALNHYLFTVRKSS